DALQLQLESGLGVEHLDTHIGWLTDDDLGVVLTLGRDLDDASESELVKQRRVPPGWHQAGIPAIAAGRSGYRLHGREVDAALVVALQVRPTEDVERDARHDRAPRGRYIQSTLQWNVVADLRRIGERDRDARLLSGFQLDERVTEDDGFAP